jgi:chemotaxis protein MotB|tara:strand:+ start:21058 stop:22698 length:1641 start_codon:yes stop_codon:yes gene_type:complete
MALKRSGSRFEASIWPGFVDAMTALLLILFFVLSIFMIVQFALRETITGQGRELDNLSAQLIDLADALGLEQSRVDSLENNLGKTQQSLENAKGEILLQLSTIATMTDQSNKQIKKISNFETQIAGLLLDKFQLEGENVKVLSQKKAVELALARARNEINEKEENARLSAAKREALEALILDLQNKGELQATQIDVTSQALSQAEKSRLVEIAAAKILRDRLQNADTELSAMTLSLEAQRKKAEETLTLLAAANSARKSIEIDYNKSLSEAELQAVLVSQANELLNKEKTLSANSQRKLALLNAQTEELRNQLNQLQSLLDRSNDADAKSKIQLKMLGTNLNAALARVAAEQRKVAIEQTKVATEQKKLAAEQKKLADLEIKERERLAAEAIDLKKFRSEFFGRLREVMEGQEGVRIVGDRFVFSSEVLFQIGSADLGQRGKREIRKVAVIINQIADEIPSGIDWILRVDGHTDSIPITNGINFSDNWELSQARALSVVRYLINDLNIPANRLAANGFGEFQPIDDRKTPEAYKTNRRIELKFTER